MSDIKSWAATDTGPVRKRNEDSMLSRPDLRLWVVADGVGGQHFGELASGMVASELAALPGDLAPALVVPETRRTVARVHEALRQTAAGYGVHVNIATTLVSLSLEGDVYACLWAGDSRAYLLRQGILSCLSRDHSLVQEMVDSGHLDAMEAERHPYANVITRAVGAEAAALELDLVTGPVLPGDIFLLCSDGLNKSMSDLEIARRLADRGDPSPADTLVNAALENGARDNVTVIVIHI
jgi:protein phosphatase/serine/threonine-protein phosphatase Stp1